MWGFLQAPPATFGISGQVAPKTSGPEYWDGRKLPLLELAPPHKQRPAVLQPLRSSSSCSRVGHSPGQSSRENSSSRLQWPPQLNHLRFSDYRNSDSRLSSAAKSRATSWSSIRRCSSGAAHQACRRQPSSTARRLDYPVTPSPCRERSQQSRSPPPGSAKLPGLPRRMRSVCSPPPEKPAGRALQAMQGDKDFQKRTLQQFVEESDEYCRSLASMVGKRQEGQFFNFLCDAGEQILKPEAKDNIPTAMTNFDFLQGECSIAGEDCKISYSMEFTPRELADVRSLLRSYAQASSPTQVVGHWTGSHTDADVIFRPTFCRFLLDSRLVSETVGDGRAPYHHAVSIFDKFASPLRNSFPDGSPQLNPDLRVCRTMSIENCVGVVLMLVEQSQPAEFVAHQLFNEGLPAARKIVDALLTEASICAGQAAETAGHFVTEHARKQRRMDILIHNPPLWCDWTEWRDGMHRWIEAFDETYAPSAAAERCQQQLALKCFLDDVFVEPGCLHVCSVFHALFEELFGTYHDERRKRHDGKLLEDTYEPHMSRAAFFRFCLDFSFFPKVCSFDEVLLAYDEAESLTYLGKKTTPTEKWRRAARKIGKMIHYLRHFGLLRWSGSGQPSHSACATELHISDQHKRQISMESRQLARIVGYRPDRKEHARDSHSPVVRSASTDSTVSMNQRSRPSSKNTRRPQRTPSINSSAETPPLGVSQEHSWLLTELNCRADAVQEALAGEHHTQPPFQMRRRLSVSTIHSNQHGDSHHSEDSGKLHATAGRKLSRSPSKNRCDRRHSQLVPCLFKAAADFTWIPRKFDDMSELQRQIYALLRALAHCTAERFLNVKQLFQAVGEGGETGLVDSFGFMRALSNLHVEHEFDEVGICACMSILSPTGESKMDIADLEKAVSQVRDDMHRRRFADTPEQVTSLEDGLSFNASTSLGKQTWIGSVPTTHSHSEVNRKRKGDKHDEYVFGCAAFMESMLRLTIWHLHKSGVAIKAASTGGMKAMWMIIFLRYQFSKMLKTKRSAETSVLSDASTCAPGSVASPSFPLSLSDARVLSFGPRRNSLNDIRDSEEQTEESAGEDVEELPSGARFVSSKERLIAKEMLLLAHFATAGPDNENLLADTRLDEECGTCGHCRSLQGVGNIFCDVCSGVDDNPLSSHIFFPIIQRRRFQSEATVFSLQPSTCIP